MFIPINISSNSYLNFPLNASDNEIIEAFNYLESQQGQDGSLGGIAVSSWACMAISAAEKDPHDWGYLVEYLEEKSIFLDPEKATDWERHTLAISACNEDPRDFGGIDFIDKIVSFYDGEQIDGNVYLYDDIFAVLSLISAGVDINSDIVQNICNYIISERTQNGGWGETDATSVAIMALISAGVEPDSNVIQDALLSLKNSQCSNGGFLYGGQTNSASTSWAVSAIVSTGGDPTSDYWKKNGNSAIDYILSLQNKDGSFNYTTNENINPIWMTAYTITSLLGKYYPVNIIETGQNSPPNKPSKPSGKNLGLISESFSFSSSTDDPDFDKVQYRFDWDSYGKHDYSSWTELDESGHAASLSHSWTEKGTYSVKAQARDINGLKSDWSDGLIITIKSENQDWSGNIRIEGSQETIYQGTITVTDTYYYAKNVDTNQTEQHYIEHPSVLGALIKASENAGFTYELEYWPSWDATLIKTIQTDSDWWHYYIDYQLPMTSADKYQLQQNNKEILIGYLENWNAHALKIQIDKEEVHKNEEFSISVKDENNSLVEFAEIIVNSKKYITDKNGTLKFSNDKSGTLKIFAEKDGFIRSQKKLIDIKKDIDICRPIENSLYFSGIRIFNGLKKTWIIGKIDIKVNTEKDVDKVEFYINDEIEYTDYDSPFEYEINQKSFLKKYEIKTVSYSEAEFNVFEILEKIRELLRKKETDNIIGALNEELKDIFNEKYIENGYDSIQLININLFPALH